LDRRNLGACERGRVNTGRFLPEFGVLDFVDPAPVTEIGYALAAKLVLDQAIDPLGAIKSGSATVDPCRGPERTVLFIVVPAPGASRHEGFKLVTAFPAGIFF